MTNIEFEHKLQEAERRAREHRLSEFDPERLKELVRRKAKALDFLERYGGGHATPTPPYKMRVTYDTFMQRDFDCKNAVELVFNMFDCCQDLIKDYRIVEQPESIVLSVWRQTYKPPIAEKRVHPVYQDPRPGAWMSVISLKLQERTPFFSFEELELAHRELWIWVPEYARRKLNPCSEIPLVEQKLGTFLPMQ